MGIATPASGATLVGWKLLLKGIPFSCGVYMHLGTECKHDFHIYIVNVKCDFHIHCEIYSLTSVCRLDFTLDPTSHFSL